MKNKLLNKLNAMEYLISVNKELFHNVINKKSNRRYNLLKSCYFNN